MRGELPQETLVSCYCISFDHRLNYLFYTMSLSQLKNMVLSVGAMGYNSVGV